MTLRGGKTLAPCFRNRSGARPGAAIHEHLGEGACAGAEVLPACDSAQRELFHLLAPFFFEFGWHLLAFLGAKEHGAPSKTCLWFVYSHLCAVCRSPRSPPGGNAFFQVGPRRILELHAQLASRSLRAAVRFFFFFFFLKKKKKKLATSTGLQFGPKVTLADIGPQSAGFLDPASCDHRHRPF